MQNQAMCNVQVVAKAFFCKIKSKFFEIKIVKLIGKIEIINDLRKLFLKLGFTCKLFVKIFMCYDASFN